MAVGVDGISSFFVQFLGKALYPMELEEAGSSS
jgi:hypothetical protein